VAEDVVRLGTLGFEDERALESGDGLVASAAIEAGDTEVEPSGVVSGREAHGLPQCGGGLRVATETFQDVAHLMMRLGERPIERLGADQGGEGLRRATEPAE